MTPVSRLLAMVVVLGLGPWGGSATWAAPAPENQCAADKVETTGNYMRDVLSCHAQAAGAGTPVGRECLFQAERKLDAAFAAIEKGSCKTEGDSGVAANRVDVSVGELLAMLSAPPKSLCAQLTLTAMGKDADRQHACLADAVEKGVGFSVDAQCQAKATNLFLLEFARAQAAGPCVTATTDGPTLDAGIGERPASAGRRSRRPWRAARPSRSRRSTARASPATPAWRRSKPGRSAA